MDLEYLFESALVALGPPLPMRRVTRDGIQSGAGDFNECVRKYYELLAALGVVPDEACSYKAFSEWFHDRR